NPNSAPNGYCSGVVTDSCGFCEGPGVVEQDIVATQIASGNDVGGCNAAAGASGLWLVPFAWLFIRRRRVS
ncbi:MAG: hypothetical protein AAFQ82_02610, partial [Myxococcota bacterium]